MSYEESMKRLEEEMTYLSEPLLAARNYPHPDWQLNAKLHLTREAWDAYANGYKKAADTVIDHASEWDVDYLVYPVVFLYRHYLELRLKDLLIVSSRLLGRTTKMPTTHKLLPLWQEVRPNIEAVWSDPQSKAHNDAIEARLQELAAVDSGSFAFRYPEDREGDPTLAEIRGFNLRQVKDVLQAISTILDGASIGIGEYLDQKHEAARYDAEMMAEYQAEMANEFRDYYQP